LVAKVDYMTVTDPIKEAKTATGGSFRSDGRTLILTLPPDSKQYTSAFADLFSAVLKAENPDTGEWSDASGYLQSASNNSVELTPISKNYRVLIVPGFMSACASSAPAFQEGQDHLREKHGVDVELFQVPNDSSEANAARIAEYVRGKMQSDPRKFIVVGYSKGAPDVQVRARARVRHGGRHRCVRLRGRGGGRITGGRRATGPSRAIDVHAESGKMRRRFDRLHAQSPP
jgi:hypothetical protein